MTNLSNKTIWYCHHYAGSPSLGMSYRPYYLSRAFQAQGHHAVIISAAFHHLLITPQPQQAKVIEKNIDGVPFIQLRTRAYQNNGMTRILNMLDYARSFKQAYKQLISITGVPDIIIVSSAHLFHFPVLARIAKKYKARLIFEVRDLWPLSLNQLLNLSTYHPLSVWLSYLEKQACRKSDKVVSVLKHAGDYMQSRGMQADKFCYIPNGVCLDEFPATVPDSEYGQLTEQAGLSCLKIGYAGAMGEPNALNYLLDAMAILKQRAYPVHLFMLGDGHLKDNLVEQCQQQGLTAVTFLPKVAKSTVPAFLAAMDCLYLGWQDSPIYQYGVSPNKLFDYMAAGKPIIESGGDANGILNEIACGIQCAAADPIAIANAIEQMGSISQPERSEMGLRASQGVKSYDYHHLAAKYAELFT